MREEERGGRPLERREFVAASALAAGGLALGGGFLEAAPEARRMRVVRPTGAPGVDPAARELLHAALDAARAAGAEYADARLELVRTRSLSTRERQIRAVSEREARGVGVRSLSGGSWGFAATQELSTEAVTRAAESSASLARANARVERSPLKLAPVEGFGEVSWTSAHEVDPFEVPLSDQVELLLSLNALALRAPDVRFVSSGFTFVRIDKNVATTDGTTAAQRIVRVNPSVEITAVSSDRTDFQTRSAVLPPAGRGWEYVRDGLTPEAMEVWAAEASEKLRAAPVEPGSWDLVLHPSHLWLTIHESIGHPTELDRALGFEANYAGTSFLAPPEAVIGKLRYGPELMQVEAERTSEGGLASVGWDDEGVPADRWLLVRDGVFVDYQTTRDQVAWISDLTGVGRSHGCAYADGWESIPFQRMPNINLLPGREDLSAEDVMAAVDRGIWIEGDGSYSIDQQRYNFQFGGQVFREIRAGKLGRMLRDVAYQARTTDFWSSMALLGGASTYRVGGSFFDGKGQPPQSNAVSHGCPVTLFRRVHVLNTGPQG